MSDINPTPEKKKMSPMGCLLGCLGATALFALAVYGFIYFLFHFGPFAAAPQVDTAARLGGGPALMLRVDAEAPGAFSLGMLNDPGLNAYNGAMLRMLRPYEATFQVEPAAQAAVVGVGAAMSMPRGANVLLGLLADARKSFERDGREVSRLDVDPENKGVLIGRGTLPLPAEAQALRAEAWPEPLPGEAPVPEGGHFIEWTLDNRTGAGGLALAAMAQAFGEESEAASPPQLSLLSQVRIIKGSRLVRTAQGSIDFTPAGDVSIAYHISAANEVCAILIAGALAQAPDGIRDAIKELDAEDAVQVSPMQTREGAEIRGEITIVGVTPAMREGLKEFNESRGTDPFGFMGLPQDLPSSESQPLRIIPSGS